jgi:hypothetical protein
MCRVYHLPPYAILMCRVYPFSTTRSNDVPDVSLSANSSKDVQDVSFSTARSMDARVYQSSPPALWTCLGCYPVHCTCTVYPSKASVLGISLSTLIHFLNGGISDCSASAQLGIGKNANAGTCRVPEDRYPVRYWAAPASECSGTGQRCRMPDWRFRRLRLKCRCPAVSVCRRWLRRSLPIS